MANANLAPAVNMNKQEEAAMKNCIGSRSRKTALPAIAIPALVGWAIHHNGLLKTPRSWTIGTLCFAGWMGNNFYQTEVCIKQIKEQFPNGILASRQRGAGRPQWLETPLDLIGIQSTQADKQPDDKLEGGDHFSGFADSHNNPQNQGFDASNMRTVDNDNVIAAFNKDSSPQRQRESHSYEELRALNRSPQGAANTKPQPVDSYAGLLTNDSRTQQLLESKPKAPQYYDPPPTKAAIKRNKYGDVIEE